MPVGFRPVELLAGRGEAKTPDDPIVACTVNGVIAGLNDPVRTVDAVNIVFLRFSDPEGKKLYWHSAAHVLGAALEAKFGECARLTDGPPVVDAEGGFFYELNLATHGAQPTRLHESMFTGLEEAAKAITKLKAPFIRLEVTREFAKELFRDNSFKLQMIDRIPDGEPISVYRCGPFVDLCRGPHVPHTGVFKALKFFKIGGSHVGSGTQAPGSEDTLLQRVYGIAFPSSKALDAWDHAIQEAKRRDHRIIGTAQELFFFHELSPGCAFLLPHGARVYNRLLSMLKREYVRRGYEEVMTPLMYKTDLWKTSGHLAAYAENMFSVHSGVGGTAHHDHGHEHDHDEDNASYGLKPMNCPGHCLVFSRKSVSYRELPIRLADFSALHRNEASGALGGMTRLRRFHQDDAHIFCTRSQIQQEVHGCLEFISYVYGLFGFSFRMKLSTRPEKYVGELATWEDAERSLRDALQKFLDPAGSTGGRAQIDVDEGGGAFYGPKIDVFVRDAIGREHQCATVQLDFQMPSRFHLTYDAGEGKHDTPVMIHRAIMGSMERMMAILTEHTAGRWPFWLSPRQVLIVTVNDKNAPYAHSAARSLCEGTSPSAATDGDAAPQLLGNADACVWVEVDDSARTINKKVRDGQVAQFNVIAVAGDAEQRAGTLALRFRDPHTRDDFLRVARVQTWLTDDERAALDAPATSPVSLTVRTFTRLAAVWQRVPPAPASP